MPPFRDDEDGNTVLDDGLSIYDGDEHSPGMTSAQAAALRQAGKQQRKCQMLLLVLTFVISVVVATSKYFSRSNALYSEGDDQWWNIWENGSLDKANKLRLNRTIDYLVAANISGNDDWVPMDETATGSLVDLIMSMDSPQYMAALWIATIDQRRLQIPDAKKKTQSSLDEYLFVQRYVLAVLFFATGGLDHWTYALRFLSGSHECYWYDVFGMDGLPPDVGILFGIRCDQDPDTDEGDEWQRQRIVTQILMLPANSMEGTLPMELHHLKYLKELHIDINPGITGTIPPEYGSFSRLQKLALSYNSIEGKIPMSFSSLKNLEQLNLEMNFLVCNTNDGEMDFIKDLVNLTNLSLEYNANVTGTLPNFIASLPRLELLALSNTAMSGTIPSSWSSMKNLQYLLIDDNRLSGSVDVLQNMTNLTHVYLQGNRFNGTIDDSFFSKLTNLVQLDISNNTFRGTVPGHFFNMSDLEVLDMSLNQLTGQLPGAFMFFTKSNLQHLALNSNNITGSIPKTIMLPNLTHLDLSLNRFSGDIPSEIGDMVNLTYLFLGRNNFTAGVLPNWLQNLTNLTELSLKATSMTGSIPGWLGNKFTDLEFLDLGENSFTGPLPASLGNLTKLWVLILNKNQLNGTIPQSLSQLTDLEVFLIDDNSFKGNTSAMCARLDEINYFIADCATSPSSDKVEIHCDCCTLCCNDENVTCNDSEWFGNHESMWENGYTRWKWQFDSGSVSPLLDKR